MVFLVVSEFDHIFLVAILKILPTFVLDLFVQLFPSLAYPLFNKVNFPVKIIASVIEVAFPFIFGRIDLWLEILEI